MPRVDRNYRRWKNESNDDDDDEGTNQINIPLERNPEEEEPMQIDGNAFSMMMTPRSPEENQVPKRSATARLLCIFFLMIVVCLTVGILVGYVISPRSHNASVLPASVSCPTSTTTTTTTAAAATTTTTTTTTTTSSSEFELTSTNVPETPGLDFDHLEDIASISVKLLSHLTPQLIKHYIRNISDVKPDQLKDYISSTLQALGFTVEKNVFPVMTSSADKENPNIVEIVMENDTSHIVNNATESLDGFSPFSGFSPNDTACGSLIYANFATEDDFKILEENDINVTGTILLVRQGDLHPAIQVHNAEKRGVLGVILYPDPKDFGGSTPNASYPQSSALPSDGVVWQNLRVIPGDPSTPNHASQKDVYRIPKEKYLGVPSIPVQPVSSDTGSQLLNLLNGSEVPAHWKGDLGVDYRFGNSFKDGVKEVRLTTYNLIEEDHGTVLHAYLPSLDKSNVIHVGCHYEIKDLHLTSSGIGLASFLSLADALKKTYPNGTYRRISFLTFEGRDGDFSAGNEYSQLFSWWLESTALAYIDMDSILEGSGFVEANVSPILRETVKSAFYHVAWVGDEALDITQGLLKASSSRKEDQDLHESFKYSNPYECDESVNFVNVHGIPSIQLTAVSLKKNHSFYLQNSQYDKMEAVVSLEDKDLLWTHMIVSAMSVATLTLSSTLLPPVRFNEVGWDLQEAWSKFLQEEKKALVHSQLSVHDLTERITLAFDHFTLTCESVDTWYNNGHNFDSGTTPFERFRVIESRMGFFRHFGRRFLRPRNLPRHSDFGSLLTYGPSSEDPCEGTYFPFVKLALRNAVEGKASWDVLREELSLLLSSLALVTNT